MGDTFEVSMAKTMSDFNSIVLPRLKEEYPGMKFVEIEGRAEDEVTKDFDMCAGIDVYRLRPEVCEMVGIASRIQRCKPGDKPFNSFTVRKSRESGAMTEYEKRKYAIQCGALYPQLTIQAYIHDGGLTMAIMRTTDLIDYIDKYDPPVLHTGWGQYGQAEFYACYWDTIQRYGYKVRIFKGAA